MAGMKGKPASECPIWLWPLLGFLLPIGVGGLFLFFQWSQWESKDKRQTTVDEKIDKGVTEGSPDNPPVYTPSSLPAPTRPSSVLPETVETSESTKESYEDPDPPIDFQRCVVILVKAFDYSFERASEKCRSDAPAAP
jgi:hypothetical protein